MIQAGFEAKIYRTVPPVLHQIEPLIGCGYEGPSDYGAYGSHQKVVVPDFWNEHTVARMFHRGDDETPSLFTLWSQGEGHHSFLGRNTRDDLLNPPNKGGLGVYEPHLFTRWFPANLYTGPGRW